MNQGLFHNTDNAVLSIKNCIFENNLSLARGSIIFAENNNSNTFLKNVTFTHNYAV